ncbi:MAG: ABC transporter ATP-binding protein [Clostridia bacterium]|nr:ABC transporter ATP-binding protein [Clostridia bacterium]
MSKTITIDHVDKYYGDFQAIKDVSLSIREGEFFTLLGPSGCGKTTLLRMIAGFNTIEKGEIRFGDTVINHVPTYKRNIGMVFQSYAIFPHLTVRQNVAYGLKARKVPKAEMNERVNRAMKLTQIDQYADRQPQQLSGGQQQRVALSRAIVIEPDLLLMDEPLSNLDAKLRVEMRTAIREIQRALNITTIYVTHDQEEALAVSDRIAVMNVGVVEQVGRPYDIYAHPNDAFVANFIGTSNFLEGEAEAGGVRVLGETHLDCALKKPWQGPVRVSVRPEHIELEEPRDGAINGEIKIATFLGDFINYEVRLHNGQIIQANQYVHLNPRMRELGEKVSVNVERFIVFTGDGKEALS